MKYMNGKERFDAICRVAQKRASRGAPPEAIAAYLRSMKRDYSPMVNPILEEFAKEVESDLEHATAPTYRGGVQRAIRQRGRRLLESLHGMVVGKMR